MPAAAAHVTSEAEIYVGWDAGHLFASGIQY
jgi:hypothetical protein